VLNISYASALPANANVRVISAVAIASVSRLRPGTRQTVYILKQQQHHDHRQHHRAAADQRDGRRQEQVLRRPHPPHRILPWSAAGRQERHSLYLVFEPQIRCERLLDSTTSSRYPAGSELRATTYNNERGSLITHRPRTFNGFYSLTDIMGGASTTPSVRLHCADCKSEASVRNQSHPLRPTSTSAAEGYAGQLHEERRSGGRPSSSWRQ